MTFFEIACSVAVFGLIAYFFFMLFTDGISPKNSSTTFDDDVVVPRRIAGRGFARWLDIIQRKRNR